MPRFVSSFCACLIVGLVGISAAGAAEEGSPIPAPELLHLRFDETSGSTAVDATGQGRDAAISGSPTWTTGQVGGALSFSGANGQQAEDADAGAYLNGLSAITIAAWIKSDNADTDSGWLYGKQPDGGGGGTLMMRHDKAGWFAGSMKKGMQFQLATTEGGVGYETASNVQTTGWQHVVFVWQAGQLPIVYLDGQLDVPSYVGGGTTGESGIVRGGTLTGIETLVIGRSAKDTESSWDGCIDDLRIYDRALDATEVAELYAGEPVPTLTTTLLVGAEDDGGPGQLSYTWSTVSKPSGAGNPVIEGLSLTGAEQSAGYTAKAGVTLPAPQPGTYRFKVVVRDGANQTVEATVEVLAVAGRTVTLVDMAGYAWSTADADPEPISGSTAFRGLDPAQDHDFVVAPETQQ